MAINGPKWTRGALDVINNTYVVQNGLLFEYYPISCVPHADSDKFIKLQISPGVMVPGIAIVGKKLYDMSLEDLFRRRINVAKRHGRTDDANVVKSSPAKKTEDSTKLSTDSNESTLGKLFGGEIDKVADLAWQNEIDTLLQTFYEEEGEEFEVTSSSQSRQPDEGSAVSNLFEDT